MTLIQQVGIAAVFILCWSRALGIPEVYIDKELSGPQCPRVVTFTCNALDFNSATISYFINDRIVAQYSLTEGDTFPIIVMTEPVINATAQLQNVSFNGRSVSYINFTLSVSLTELMAFEGSNITCGSDTNRSNGLPISRFTIKEIELDVNRTVVFVDEKLVNIMMEWYNTLAGCEVDTNFTTELRNDNDELLNISQPSCSGTKCCSNVSVENFNSTTYNILLKVNTGYSSKNFSFNISASHSNYLNYSIRLDNCAVEVVCTPRINETCVVSPNGSSIEINGFYEDKFIISTIHINNLRNDNKIQFIDIYGIAIAIFILGIILHALGCVLYLYSRYSRCVYTKLSCKPVLIYNLILLLLEIISLILWITFGALPYDTCIDEATSKNNVLIAVFICSIVCLSLSVVAIGGCVISIRKNVNETDEHESHSTNSMMAINPILCSKCKERSNEGYLSWTIKYLASFIWTMPPEELCVSCNQVLCRSKDCPNQRCPQQTNKKVYCRLCFTRMNQEKSCSPEEELNFIL